MKRRTSEQAVGLMDDALTRMASAGWTTVGGLIHTSPFAIRIGGKLEFFIVMGEGPVRSATEVSLGIHSGRVVFQVIHVGNGNHAGGVDKNESVDDVADFWR